MRLSESLQRGIMKVSPGNIINTFKLGKRRNVVFFEELLANYIKKCEDAGYEKEMYRIGREWAFIFVDSRIPDIFRNAPMDFIFLGAETIWKNAGLVERVSISLTGNEIKIETEGEAITRFIGKNMFMAGILDGILCFIFKRIVKLTKITQNDKNSTYIFQKTEKSSEKIPIKHSDSYGSMNEWRGESGKLDMKNALKNNMFQLKDDNRMYFRGKSLMLLENTLFHVIGNSGICTDTISDISFHFFKNIISSDSTPDEKLILLKNLIHSMGWGNIKIVSKNNNIQIELDNLPIGIQIYPDNYEFLYMMILGYLHLIEKKLVVDKVITNKNKVIINYSKKQA